jgi:hypothetical protein
MGRDIDKMLNDFLVYAKGIGLEPPFGKEEDNRHGRLEFGRHYGVPSPLIDFSYSPFVAAFFAFSGVRRPTAAAQRGRRRAPKKRAAIYCLNLQETASLWARFKVGPGNQFAMEPQQVFVRRRTTI